MRKKKYWLKSKYSPREIIMLILGSDEQLNEKGLYELGYDSSPPDHRLGRETLYLLHKNGAAIILGTYTDVGRSNKPFDFNIIGELKGSVEKAAGAFNKLLKERGLAKIIQKK